MLNKLFTQVGRYPHGVLPTCLALAVILGLLDPELTGSPWIIVALFGLAILAEIRFHPATLAVRDEPRAFDVTNNAALVLSIGALVAGVGALAWVQVLRPARVRIRPDGIEEVKAFSAFFVPWEALDGAEAERDRLLAAWAGAPVVP